MKKEATLKRLEDAIADATNQIKYDVKYRLKMQDGEDQWFRANAEVTRRLGSTARRIVGIFMNIDQEEKAAMRAEELIQDNVAKNQLIDGMVELVSRFAVCNLEENWYKLRTMRRIVPVRRRQNSLRICHMISGHR